MIEFTIDNQLVKTVEKEIGINFDSKRKRILQLFNQNKDIQACAGSGKTTLLAAKLILISKIWNFNKRGVCVLTHTNVAKKEIIKRLEKNSTGWRLLEYPHFIGTIQEFVNKHFSLPFLYNKYPINHIDDDRYIGRMLLNRWKYIYLNGNQSRKYPITYLFNNKQLNPGEFYYKFDGNNLIVNPEFTNKFNSKINIAQSNLPANYLEYKKNEICSMGYFTYKDMYAIANKYLIDNNYHLDFVRYRFPIVFIDEFQDTQKFQDDFLQKIFPLNSTNNLIQRFGDADQQIFDGFGTETPNESFNPDTNLILDDTYRFSLGICHKVDSFSINSNKTSTNVFSNLLGGHKIYLYKKDSDRTKVIELFAKDFQKRLSEKFSEAIIAQNKEIYLVKAIGAIGKKK